MKLAYDLYYVGPAQPVSGPADPRRHGARRALPGRRAMSPDSTGWFHAGAALLCLAWAVLTLVLGPGPPGGTLRRLPSRHGVVGGGGGPRARRAPGGRAGLEVLRSLGWLAVLLLLCHRLGARRWVAGVGLAGAVLALPRSGQHLARSCRCWARSASCRASPSRCWSVLTAENLYRNAARGRALACGAALHRAGRASRGLTSCFTPMPRSPAPIRPPSWMRGRR
jgi:hypothetical protein